MPPLAGKLQSYPMEEKPAQPGFTKIDYKDVHSINYLSDYASQHTAHLDYLQALNASTPVSLERPEQTKFDNIASELYKKIVKQGYVERPSAVSKKAKRGDTDFNYYNTNDDFIDDEEIIEKKDIFSEYKDYQCLPVASLQELYSSPLYKAKAEEVVSESLKRQAPQHFNPENVEELEKFDEIKKKIKNNIKDILNKMGSTPQANPQELQISSAPANQIIIIDDLPRPTASTTNISKLNKPKDDPTAISKEEPIVIDDGPIPSTHPQA